MDAATNGSVDAQVVRVIPSGDGLHVHMLGTAFVVRARPGGTSQHLTGGLPPGVVQSPFLWPPSEESPVVESAHGSDLFVETDCLVNGACGGAGGTEVHLMVYDNSCSANGSWRDVVTGECHR